jgi:hypothetical protein
MLLFLFSTSPPLAEVGALVPLVNRNLPLFILTLSVDESS